MFLVLYIFLGFLLFDLIIAFCLYFRKEGLLFDTPEVPLKKQKTVRSPELSAAHQNMIKLPRYSKTA